MASPVERHLFELPPDDLALALGRLSVHYGRIEHVLTATIHRTSKVAWENAFDMAQGELRSRKKLSAKVLEEFSVWADNAFPPHDATQRKRHFAGLLEKIKSLCEARDNAIHCAWGKDSSGQICATGSERLWSRPVKLQSHHDRYNNCPMKWR